MSHFFFGNASRLGGLFTNAASAVKSRPVVFNSATGFSLCGASDAVAQHVEGQLDIADSVSGSSSSENSASCATSRSLQTDNSVSATSPSEPKDVGFDYRRLLAAGAVGFFVGGFVYPRAYAKLDAIWHGSLFTTVLKKSIVEIATVGIFVNSLSMTSRGLLVGRDADGVAEHVVREMPEVTLNDARVWLPYNMVAFSVIPIALRPATTAMMESCWQAYISLRSNDYKDEAKVTAGL
mmetsp:Transcript_3489/g.7571  ORF Transcript_3489/g.7571 Transcript_3489/m.7571 type:complete len:237 (+) Transcript_3489:275-985(+)